IAALNVQRYQAPLRVTVASVDNGSPLGDIVMGSILTGDLLRTKLTRDANDFISVVNHTVEAFSSDVEGQYKTNRTCFRTQGIQTWGLASWLQGKVFSLITANQNMCSTPPGFDVQSVERQCRLLGMNVGPFCRVDADCVIGTCQAIPTTFRAMIASTLNPSEKL